MHDGNGQSRDASDFDSFAGFFLFLLVLCVFTASPASGFGDDDRFLFRRPSS